MKTILDLAPGELATARSPSSPRRMAAVAGPRPSWGKSLVALVVLVLCATLGRSAHAIVVADVDVPDTIARDGHALVLNGAALYEASIFEIDIFVIALYLPKATRSAKVAARCDAPLSIDIHWTYSAGLGDIYDRWRETMRHNAGADLPALAERIEQLMHVLQPTVDGQTWSFDYGLERGLTVTIGGAVVATIPGQDFCELLVRGYVGPSADPVLRRGLLGKR